MAGEPAGVFGTGDILTPPVPFPGLPPISGGLPKIQAAPVAKPPLLPAPAPQTTEQQAYVALKSPNTDWSTVDPAVKLHVVTPSDPLARLIEADPQMKAGQQAAMAQITKELGAGTPTQTSSTAAHAAANQFRLPSGAMTTARPGSTDYAQQAAADESRQLPGATPNPQEAAFGAQLTGGILPKLLTETSQTLVGLGPGLVDQAYKEGQDLGQAMKGDFAFKNSRALGDAISQSYQETVNNPGHQYHNDPLGFFTNVLTPLFAGAGAVARAAELSRLAKAGELTPARITKTLIRPQPQERSITAKFGDVAASSKPFVNITPASEKAIEELMYAGEEAGGSIDHYEDLHVHALRGVSGTAEPDFAAHAAAYEGKASPVKDPATYLNRLGGLIEAVRADATTPQELDHFNALAEQVYSGLHTNLTRQEMYRMGGPPQTLLHEFGRLMGSVAPGQVTQTHPPELPFGREDPHAVLNEASQRISGSGGEGFTIHPPAYKSALGGYLQTKLLDPLLEKHLNSPNPYTRQQAGRVGETLKIGSTAHAMGPAARFGRKARTEMLNDVRARAGAFAQGHALQTVPSSDDLLDSLSMKDLRDIAKQAGIEIAPLNEFGRAQPISSKADLKAAILNSKMPEDRAVALARASSFTDRWRQIHQSGASLADTLKQPWRDWVAIRQPPGPETQLKASDFASEGAMHDKFLRGNGMIPSKAELEKDPDAFRYVPGDMLRSMAPYKAGTGAEATAVRGIDSVTQLIRSGRFLTPAYAQWAAQNGLIHLSQAGAFVFRNMWQLKNEWSKMKPTTRAAIDGYMGRGQAMATRGERPLKDIAISGKNPVTRTAQRGVNLIMGSKMAAIQHAWHNFNDQWARRMAAIHELNHAGYHSAASWDKLWEENPQRMNTILGGQANREAINYTEMTPAERALFSRAFTAYGWTRGASTYAGRFALQHPVQARVGEQVGQQGSNLVDRYYRALGGMAPAWIRPYLPLGGGRLLSTTMVNPAGTLGALIGETPGAVIGQTESLASEEAPAVQAILGLLTGVNKFGTKYKGTSRLTGPLADAVGRFKPYAAIRSMAGNQKGGTFTSGPEVGIKTLLGDPISQLRDAKQTAALGQKDYEQALNHPDLLAFRLQDTISKIPQEVALYKQVTGSAPPPQILQHLQGDLQQAYQRDLYEYNYANAHGAKAWKSLPATNKLEAVTTFMVQHHYITPAEQVDYVKSALKAPSETMLEKIVNELWKSTGIGAVAAAWKSQVKQITPVPLKAANK